jgi:ketosteroid isomerase-like protein
MGLTGEQMIEALQRSNELLNRGEFDAAIELAAPDIVLVRPGGLPEIRGSQAVRAWMEPDAFDSQQIELLDFEARGSKVLIRQKTNARGAASQIEMEIEALTVWTFNEDGMVVRVEAFTPAEEEAARRVLSAY